MRSPLSTVRGSDRVVPRAESRRERLTYRAWASGSTGTRRFAVGGTLIGVGVTVSIGEWSGVEVDIAERFRNCDEGLEGCVWMAGEVVSVVRM